MSNRNYFNTCQNCGATLDPGETCECEKTPIGGSNTILKQHNWDALPKLILACKQNYTSIMGKEPCYLKISWGAFSWLNETCSESIKKNSTDHITVFGLVCCPTPSLHGLEGIEVF